MLIHDQVCSVELAMKLQELGVEQNGIWSWAKSIGPPWNCRPKEEWGLQLDGLEENEPNSSECYSAFTVAELGILMPELCLSGKASEDAYNCWWKETPIGPIKHYNSVQSENEADARAVMLIWMIETEVIKVKG